MFANLNLSWLFLVHSWCSVLHISMLGANMGLITPTAFQLRATNLTWPGIGHDVNTLNVPLNVLPLSAGLVTHTTVKCFILRQDTICTDVGVKAIMLQEHCKVKGVKSKRLHLLSMNNRQNNCIQFSPLTSARPPKAFLCDRMCL